MKSKGGLVSKVFKAGLIIFNVGILVWLIGGFITASGEAPAMTSAELDARAAAEHTLGLGELMILWVAGNLILGLCVLYTRPKAR